VVRFWLSIARKTPQPLTFTLAEINDSLPVVISLTLSAVGIQGISALLNPKQWAYLQAHFSRSGG